MSSQKQALSKKKVMERLLSSLLRGGSYNDVDILISFRKDEESFDNLIELYAYLKNLLNVKIDLVTSNAISPYIAPHILREVEFIET
ncbi:MAG: nucleotidyltransferase family protein [Candidatus Hodarchaeales archaeon]